MVATSDATRTSCRSTIGSWSLVGNRQIEDLLDLPLLDDPDVLEMLDIFSEIVHPAMISDRNLRRWWFAGWLALCLAHGNSDASCFGYVWFGMFAGPRLAITKMDFEFGQLGYDFVEKRDLTRYQARTYVSICNSNAVEAKHPEKGRELVLSAFDVAQRTGDSLFGILLAYVEHQLFGRERPTFAGAAEAEKGLNFARKRGFDRVVKDCKAQLGLIRTLRGLTANFGSSRRAL